MIDVLKFFLKKKEVSSLMEEIKKENFSLYVSGACENHQYLLTYATYLQSGSFVVLLASNVYKANLAYQALCHLAGEENVNFYPMDEIVSSELLAVSSQFKKERINTIKNIINNEPKIIVTHLMGALKPNISKGKFKENIIKISKGIDIDVNGFITKLIKLGYKKTPTTTQEGEFSVRGEIIDVFGIGEENPIRINLFDTEIERIKYFDKNTQRTTIEIVDAVIYPYNEIIFNDSEVEKIKDILIKYQDNEIISRDISDLDSINNYDRMNKYLNLIDEESVSFLDYIDNKIMIYEDINRLNKANEQMNLDLLNFIETNHISKELKLTYNINYYNIFFEKERMIYCNEFKASLSDIKIDKILDIHGFMVITYDRDLRLFLSEMREKFSKTYVISLDSKERESLIKALLKENNIEFNEIKNEKEINVDKVNIIRLDNAISFGFYNELELITEKELFPTIKKKYAKYHSDENTQLQSKDDLIVGDYVVHYDYGIGRYIGIETIELNNIKNDYLVVQFENMPIYIPVEKFNMLEKYKGSEGVTPKLTRIGNKEWENKKAKIKEKVDSIAKDLIELQIQRESQKGFKYMLDNEFQEMFEEDFEFEETKDQLKISKEIKKEMEEGRVIDRLICGDVGFGKTEIAMRAAFKTVYSGKQVAYLAPTTILTRQHYYTFKERFAKYGIRVELLNRLISEKEQKRITSELVQGKVDIIIGTHRILSNDVRFKDLGLLIIDEEQRFGVIHKEAIKKLKANVNVLTLSATPIPRTLQMAIMGVRELSLIETPPLDRHPIQTYVLEYNDSIIREAIYRELGRSGQVFYLHNRISDIEIVYRRLRRLVPEARICVGHGRMTKEELEDTIQSFIDKEYDVLLCTTIIETGIDIPNSNTLIIDEADRLGLSQLYQIRGRVGRSDRIAYAYLTYRANKVLSQNEEKRLSAIKEYTTLGSGYNIAMRDLAIRGAGDILGREQSGYIDTIGLDMYMKLLDDAIKEQKGIKKEEEINYNIEVSKHVSKEYVSDDVIRIEIHKEISRINGLESKKELITSLTDRFGKLSEDILLYIEEKYMESLFKKYKIKNILETKQIVTIIIPKETLEIVSPKNIFLASVNISKDFQFEYRNNQLVIKLKKDIGNREWIYKVTRLLEESKGN